MSRAIIDQQDGSDTEPESELEEPMLWTEPEGVWNRGTPLCVAQGAGGGGGGHSAPSKSHEWKQWPHPPQKDTVSGLSTIHHWLKGGSRD